MMITAGVQNMKIIWTRDSVCMADDVNAPNTRTEEIDQPLTVAELLDKAVNYVPGVGGVVWAVWVEDILVGFLEMSTSGYLLRDEAVLDELPPPKSHRSFWGRKTDTLHVLCTRYDMGDFLYRNGEDGRPLADHFPPYASLLDMVKATVKKV